MLLLQLLAPAQVMPEAGTLVTVKKFAYQLKVPKGWHINLPVLEVPVMFNYPPERAGPQGLFPEHGAMIYCAPDLTAILPSATADIIERIKLGAEKGHIGLTVERVPDFQAGSKFPHDIVRVESDFKVDPSDELTQHEVSYFYSLGGSRYKLYINYWKGEPQEQYFQKLLRQILESVAAN
jgi:hypothetical protein